MKTVLITGAAGGVGQALARRFAAEGYALILVDRDADQLHAAARALGSDPEVMIADLTDPDDLADLCARIEDPDRPVDVLINNAGIIAPGAVGTLSGDLMRAHVQINMTAPMVLAAAATRAMKKRRAGYIFSVMSMAALGPMRNSASYAASKFGLRGFMASLALELQPHGVGVGGVFPSAVDTPMLAAEMASPDGSALNFVGNAKPISPDDLAGVVYKAMQSGKLETWLPKSDGVIAGTLMLFPSLLRPVLSRLEKQGEKKKAAYLQRLRSERA